jgi:hypothetical protein
MTNWNILTPAVEAVCEKAARQVSRRYAGVVEFDDLLQEAYIAVATREVYGRFVEDGAMGGFYVALWADLMDIADKLSSHSRNTISLERLAG